MRICAANERFSAPAAKQGLGYGYEHIRKLYDLVGLSRAKEMFFIAQNFNAEEALQMGLVNRVGLLCASGLCGRYAETIAANVTSYSHTSKTHGRRHSKGSQSSRS